MTVTIWHNPRCSKSRQTLALLEEAGTALKVRPYLNDPPNRAELEAALKMLGLRPSELIRSGEKIYRELGLSQDSDDNALISAMLEHPILIERPVVIGNGKAAIGRPPEAVLDIL